MNWAHFAFYCASLVLAGIWTFLVIRIVRGRPERPGRLTGCNHRHDWELVEDYGHVRKCRCRRCRKVALVRVITLPRRGSS